MGRLIPSSNSANPGFWGSADCSRSGESLGPRKRVPQSQHPRASCRQSAEEASVGVGGLLIADSGWLKADG